MKIIINSPSLDPKVNVSGISSVTQFIISNNKEVDYIHFEIGRKDAESQSTLSRVKRILRNKKEWELLLKQNQDAIVHYNIPLMKAAIVRDYMLIKVAHNLGMPIVLHIHGGNYIKERNRPWYIKRLLNKIFSWGKNVIVLGEEEKAILEEDFNLKNVISLPNCIDLTEATKFNRNIDRKEILDILYLGRIEPNKGIDYILDACQILKKEGVKFHLHFAGKEEIEGQYIPEFKEALGDNFTYHGIVSGAPKTELLKRCDIFLLPSFYEGLPMSLLETMSLGQVPVVTPVGSVPTVVTDKTNGIYIRVKNTADISNAVKRLITDRKLYSTLSASARQTILNKFDDCRYIKELNKMYNF
jgi:glycosyltransferase involved in cell wall biosynthesis